MVDITMNFQLTQPEEDIIAFAEHKGWRAILGENPNPISATDFCINRAKRTLIDDMASMATEILSKQKAQEAKDAVNAIKNNLEQILVVTVEE